LIRKDDPLVAASLPEEGELQLGTITLPAGKRIRAGYEPEIPVAWVTRQPVADATKGMARADRRRSRPWMIPETPWPFRPVVVRLAPGERSLPGYLESMV
jgi:hypothetical protein